MNLDDFLKTIEACPVAAFIPVNQQFGNIPGLAFGFFLSLDNIVHIGTQTRIQEKGAEA